MTSTLPKNSRSARRYEKGQRRFKHVGKSVEPTFRREDARPKQWIGLCPNNFSQDDLQRLVDEAVAAPNGDRDLDFPKRLHVVEKGAIYRLETTDRGKSYHGYPFRGRLSRKIIEELREMAKNKDCVPEFEDWLKKYIDHS
jgi:hypothetical protein